MEIGCTQLHKTVSSAEASEVPFVRVKSLEDHINRSVLRLCSSSSFSTSGNYKGKIWIKVGVRNLCMVTNSL